MKASIVCCCTENLHRYNSLYNNILNKALREYSYYYLRGYKIYYYYLFHYFHFIILLLLLRGSLCVLSLQLSEKNPERRWSYISPTSKKWSSQTVVLMQHICIYCLIFISYPISSADYSARTVLHHSFIVVVFIDPYWRKSYMKFYDEK